MGVKTNNMEEYVELQGLKVIFLTGDIRYPYLLEITEFVKNSKNPNSYSEKKGGRQFRLLNGQFIATGDSYSLSEVKKDFPNSEFNIYI